ncbi:MAG: hypothetical protein ACREBE_01575, partial [bacterium]
MRAFRRLVSWEPGWIRNEVVAVTTAQVETEIPDDAHPVSPDRRSQVIQRHTPGSERASAERTDPTADKEPVEM